MIKKIEMEGNNEEDSHSLDVTPALASLFGPIAGTALSSGGALVQLRGGGAEDDAESFPMLPHASGGGLRDGQRRRCGSASSKRALLLRIAAVAGLVALLTAAAVSTFALLSLFLTSNVGAGMWPTWSLFNAFAGGAASAPRLSGAEVGFFFYVHSEPTYIVREQLALLRIAYPNPLPAVYISSDHGPVDYAGVCAEHVAAGGRCKYVHQPTQLTFGSGGCGAKCLAPGAPSDAVAKGPAHLRLFCDMWAERMDAAVAFLNTEWTALMEGDVTAVNAALRPPSETDFTSCANFGIGWPRPFLAAVQRRTGHALSWPGFCAPGGFMVRSAKYASARWLIAAQTKEWGAFKDAAASSAYNAIDVTDTCVAATMLFGGAQGGPSLDFHELGAPFLPKWSGSTSLWTTLKKGWRFHREYPHGLDASGCMDCLRACRVAHCATPTTSTKVGVGVTFDVALAANESAAASQCVARSGCRTRCPAFIHHTKGGLCARYASLRRGTDNSFGICDERDRGGIVNTLSEGRLTICLLFGICTNSCAPHQRAKATLLHAALLIVTLAALGAIAFVGRFATRFARSSLRPRALSASL